MQEVANFVADSDGFTGDLKVANTATKADINQIVQSISNFVGQGSRILTTPKGNIQVQSIDALRKVRIDIIGEKFPHINLEAPSVGNLHIFLKP